MASPRSSPLATARAEAAKQAPEECVHAGGGLDLVLVPGGASWAQQTEGRKNVPGFRVELDIFFSFLGYREEMSI